MQQNKQQQQHQQGHQGQQQGQHQGQATSTHQQGQGQQTQGIGGQQQYGQQGQQTFVQQGQQGQMGQQQYPSQQGQTQGQTFGSGQQQQQGQAHQTTQLHQGQGGQQQHQQAQTHQQGQAHQQGQTRAGAQQGQGHQGTSGGGKHKCGVVGTGEEGAALIRTLTKNGYHVKMAHEKGVEDLSGLAKETGATPVEIRDVVKDVEFVFLCIPMKSIKDLPREVFANCPKDVVIVDCCNYYPSRDGSIPRIEEGIVESVWVQNHIGHDVVKAFNAILAKALEEAGRPKGAEDRVAIPVAGDDASARRKVVALIDDLGFDAFETGSLEDSWKQQPGSAGYCTNLDVKRLQIAISKTKREDLPKARDEAYQKMKSSGEQLDWKSLVKMLREVYVSKHPGTEDALGAGAPPVATT